MSEANAQLTMAIELDHQSQFLIELGKELEEFGNMLSFHLVPGTPQPSPTATNEKKVSTVSPSVELIRIHNNTIEEIIKAVREVKARIV